MIVRRAALDDAAAIKELIASCPDAPVWPDNSWQQFLQPPVPAGPLLRVLLMASEAGQPFLGLLAASLLEATTELELLLVRPSSRRQGTGRLLSRAWLAWAIETGAREALLEVRASNIPAQSLYQQLGFYTEGRRSGYYHQPNEDALLMRRSLNQEITG